MVEERRVGRPIVSLSYTATTVEVMPYGFEKHRMLQAWLKRLTNSLRVSPSDVFVIAMGDSPADLKMMELSDFPVAVGDDEIVNEYVRGGMG